jgi:fructose-1,6-bisphosphatase/inositol monophosphatase family enzyme
MLYTERGRGTFLNNERVRIKEMRNLSDALVGTDWGYERRVERYLISKDSYRG